MTSTNQSQLHPSGSRLPLILGTIDPLVPLLGSNQPLSPTHVTINAQQQSFPEKQKDGIQKSLKGPPSFVGLSMAEYVCDERTFGSQNKNVFLAENLNSGDLQVNYIKQLYSSFEEGKESLNQMGKIEILITLPFEMLVQQLELNILNIELFSRYLKLLKIEKIEGQTKQQMILKGGYLDSQARLFEINTTGVGQQFKITFTFDKKQVLAERKGFESQDQQQKMGQGQQKGHMTSEKLKNEILPLLNGSDDDLDELDDEVAMISHKKEYSGSSSLKDEISSEDIKLSFKDDNKRQDKQESQFRQNKIQSKTLNNRVPDFQSGKNNQMEERKKEDDPENTRNFNTLPRNYSDSRQQEENQVKMLIEDHNSKESSQAQLHQEQNFIDGNINNIEAFIFEKINHKLNDHWYQRLLFRAIKTIKFIGFNMNHVPAITNMTLFMNESFALKKDKYFNDANEIDFLVGVLMISNKRHTQASEIFRRVQAFYIKQIELLQKECKSSHNSNGQSPKQGFNNQINSRQNNNDTQKREINKLFQKCAILELLVVESMCSSIQVNDKLHSIRRMIDFSLLKLSPPIQFQQQIFFSEDSYTIMIKILPYLLRFVITCMTHRKEVVKLSGIKLLEFILETKGCSLDASMVLILKAILKTYPGIQLAVASENHHPLQQQQDSFSLSVISSNASEYLKSPRQLKQGEALVGNEKQNFNNTVKLQGLGDKKKSEEQDIMILTEHSQLKEPNSGFSSAMKNAYNHVLDTYISVLSSISSHILHQLFYEVIIQCLTTPTLPLLSSQSNLQSLNEIKIFSIKIAEKIITICQGDLLLSKASLDSLLLQVTIKSQSNDNLQISLKNLWQNVRAKVFANYSLKGMKGLIEWLVEKMHLLASNGQRSLNEGSSKSNAVGEVKVDITDEETYQLQQLLDIVSLISIGKKKNEEEANNLIKIKQDFCVDLYLLINPLLFWLDFSVEREERFSLFKLTYQTIKDVLENLPPKKVDLDILQIMIPILQKTTEYLKNNSPSLSMLKFLDIVLRDIKNGGFCARNSDLQYFFLDMLNNFAQYFPYSLYEEMFSVFDKLLTMCADVLNEKVVQKCIIALLDKYTMKSKAHKNSVALFMKGLLEVKVSNHQQKDQVKHHSNNNMELDDGDMDEEQISIHSKNNFFDILTDFCFFKNDDPSVGQSGHSNEVLRKLKNPVDHHDMYIDKLQFFIDTLGQLNEMHINIFTSLIMHPKFKHTLLNLLSKGETTLRLKCHEILEIVTNYYVQYCTSKTVYELAVPTSNSDNLGQKRKNATQNEVMEVEFVNHERLYVSQMVVTCVRMSLDQKNDSYLQFNSLILLDFLFQNLLPVPSYQNEYLKGKGINTGGGSSHSNQNQSSEGRFMKNLMENLIDIENLEICEQTPEFEVTDERYLHMRLNLVFKLWPQIQVALNSAWSNIRSICYGLICSMLKVDLRDFQHNLTDSKQKDLNHQNNLMLVKLKQLVLPMLLTLLSSKESESKAGGLNILGSFCGLSYDFSKVKISKNLEFFKKNSNFVSLGIWQLVFDLQDDWDITIKEASVVLIQLCAPRDAVKYFDKVKKEKDNLKFSNILNRYAVTPGGGGHSSQSSRNQFYLNSGTSNEEEYQMQANGGMGLPEQKQNIMSFLSGTDDLSMVMQLDQHQFANTNLQQTDLFEMNNLHSQQTPQYKFSQARHHSKPDDEILSKKNIIDYDMQSLIGQEHPPLSHNYQNFQDQLINNPASRAGGDLDIMAELDGTLETFHFFVDEYNDDQIQEIISIFRNDFKPPKNLWIEKNPSSAFNSPDYYAEIYSQAIEQFNQQQMQLQQQQQQELQQKVSNSPKASSSQSIKSGLQAALSSGSLTSPIVDKLEDDLVRKYEEEKKQKAQDPSKQNQEKEGPKDYKIFERHFEDTKEELKEKGEGREVKQEDFGSIDAEPYKFLGEESPNESEEFFRSKGSNQVQKQGKSEKQKSQEVTQKQTPSSQLKLSILDEQENQFYLSDKSKLEQSSNPVSQSSSKQMDSKKTDELIEEYERKINKTIQLLEEEKKKSKANADDQTKQENVGSSTIESNAKSTPEFKKKERAGEGQSSKDGKQQKKNQTPGQTNQQAALYLSELSRGYINNNDNMKLMKQINTVFSDTSLNFQGTQPNTSANGQQKQKQKLNKSFENVMAAQKSLKNSTSQDPANKSSKKNLSTSPKRGSSSGKKIGISSKSSGSAYNKRKYIVETSKNLSGNGGKGLYNSRDLNFFIKTIEKDLNEKFKNAKDFNSMPTTPTSILKKVEDQLKALALKKDAKVYMSNTCPNIAQVLSSLDTSQTSKSNQVLQISNIQNLSQVPSLGSKGQGSDTVGTSTNHTPSNVSQNLNIFGGGAGQNGGIQSSQQQQQNLEKFSFSKTQKIDLNSINKNIFGYNGQAFLKEENTQRDQSNENFGKGFKISPKIEEKQLYTNLLKSSKNPKSSSKHAKRSRGSQDKYALGYGVNAMALMSSGQSQASGSSSQSKLNKSANMIQANQTQIAAKFIKKQQLSKSFIDGKGLTTSEASYQQQYMNNLSPTSQKQQAIALNQYSSNVGGLNTQLTTLLQTPATNNNHQGYNTHSTNGSNMLYEYKQTSESISKKLGGISQMSNIGNYNTGGIYNKTPIKSGGKNVSGGFQYSEILDVSPSSGEKDTKIINRSIF